jgi:hypothetical protein
VFENKERDGRGCWEAHHKSADGDDSLSNCEILCFECYVGTENFDVDKTMISPEQVSAMADAIAKASVQMDTVELENHKALIDRIDSSSDDRLQTMKDLVFCPIHIDEEVFV